MKMTNNRNIVFFLLLYFFILLIPTYNLPLFETTEARYSEVAREMIATGNYLEPYFEGVKHFHKPPFAYWMMAAGVKIFGTNGFGVRFFGVIAAVFSVFFLYKTARLFFKEEDDWFLSLLVMASSLLFLVISRIASTDIYLTFFTIAAQYFLFKQIFYEKSALNASIYGILLGLGFLTKGPIIFLFTILPYLSAKIFFKSHRKCFNLKDILLSAALFAVIALPWYIAVIVKNSDLLYYFLKVQTVDRVATNRFGRDQAFYFFFVIFLVSFFPHIVYFIKSIINFKKLDSFVKAILIYILLPFIVFQISVSKLATYILPFYGTASLVAYYGYKNFSSTVLNRTIIFISFIFPAALALSGYFYEPLYDFRYYTMLCALILITFLFSLFKHIYSFKSFLTGIAFFYIMLTLLLYFFIPYIGPNIKGYKQMSHKLNSIDPEKNIQTLLFRTSKPSVSFYRNKLAVTALEDDRYLGFQKTDEYKKYYYTSEEQVQQFVVTHEMFFLVTKPEKYLDFQKEYGTQCERVFEQRKYSAYKCSSKGLK
ncbi:glycosyl transferase family 39 [Flexistipes sinusarabici DSM 4947]|uniref:Glycosyl transferase family 39 n=1 Tax=Flexistipes sinusarabici (strain ATCC 49648 / DSM 4947 / MAS 10) TaxID=717231 RepID=F8E835_FLESM|nr:glycosyltransferase family 39 protein [Flexistipes sinusarabici]AEI13959.1 glycosyl transferase family 39 [Flexistipes sinusarabici DSM 4947]